MTGPSLDRFRQAQDRPFDGFATALGEDPVRREAGPLDWYVFPQLDGLGRSAMSEAYAIRGLAEARAYLLDLELGSRLLTITEALAAQTRRGASLLALMDWRLTS